MIVRDSVITNWLITAVQGETLVYARATALPFGSTVGKRMRELAASGHVSLYQTRRDHGPGDENFHYTARRPAKPLPGQDAPGFLKVNGVLPVAPKPQDRRFTSHAAVVREIEPQVRSLLAEGAERNARKLARMLGIYSSNPVQAVLERMAA
jgi:hypothetical protein